MAESRKGEGLAAVKMLSQPRCARWREDRRERLRLRGSVTADRIGIQE